MYTLPDYVEQALKILNNAGYEAYIVGGSVRDMLLGIQPDDYDIATSAKPQEISEIFEKTVGTGLKHGTVTAIVGGRPIEITTFRSDGSYSDHRKPDRVEFVCDIEKDLARRDFTVNAMAYSAKTGIIDKFSGVSDIKNKIIRAVGNPEERFNEDALRILRALRFSAKLGFEIEPLTMAAVINKAPLLEKISRERIFCEISKTLTAEKPSVLGILINCGGLEFIGLKGNAETAVLDLLNNSLPLRFYALCLICRTSPVRLCRELKTDNGLLKYCKEADTLFCSDFGFDKSGIKKMLSAAGEKTVRDYLILQNKLFGKPSKTSVLDEILSSCEPYRISDLAIGGAELEALGYKGKRIGEVLKILTDAVIEDPENNKKEILIKYAQKLNQ